MSINPIPAGYNSVSVHLFVSDARAHIAFIQQAFSGDLREYVEGPDGRVVHAALRIGDSMVMLGECAPGQQLSRVTFYIYTPDCDAMFHSAVAAGGTVVRDLANQLYGDRNGGVTDRDGNEWWIGSHIETLSDEEIAGRYAAQAQSS